MRTNIDIDDRLMKQAMKATGATTKKGAVDASLRQIVKLKNQEKIRELRGKVVWRGPDDDWFASDAEIRAKRRKAEQPEYRDGSGLPSSKRPPVPRQELG